MIFVAARGYTSCEVGIEFLNTICMRYGFEGLTMNII
jgi:hypothetical protein